MAWSMTEERYNKLINRMTIVEEHINDMFVALDNYATANQLTELLTVLTAEIQSLSTDVGTLEDRVEAIEEEPLS